MGGLVITCIVGGVAMLFGAGLVCWELRGNAGLVCCVRVYIE
jgi:hypothetical protein